MTPWPDARRLGKSSSKTGQIVFRIGHHLSKRNALQRARIRRAGRGPVPNGFVDQPEPRSIGSFARGRQVLAGNMQFTGHLVELQGASPWDINLPSQGFARDLHGFLWLDDLAAVGSADARTTAQAWVLDWIRKYRTGHGPGWDLDIAARRLIRWVHHGVFLVANLSKNDGDKIFASFSQHTRYIARNLNAPTPGLPGFEASVGALYAALIVDGLGHIAAPALDSLERLCVAQIDSTGAIQSRNPEELLDIFTLLNWAVMALENLGRDAPPPLKQAIARIAPTLRVLRHSNGHLTRFHGGGRGVDGRLDEALGQSGIRPAAPKDTAMGYVRVHAGTTTMIVDAAAPPTGPASHASHASTAAFELTAGKSPLIVNCGSGISFGDGWRLAGRATPSHSTLGIEGASSSRIAAGAGGARGQLIDVPGTVNVTRHAAIDGTRVQVSHDGYGVTHGVTHHRVLDLTIMGDGLLGEDLLAAETASEWDLLQRQIAAGGVILSARFHLHPDVDATVDMNGKAVSLSLKDGGLWVFRHDSVAQLSLEPSVYLEQGRVKPRAADQIVLTHQVTDPKTKVRWSIAKMQDPLAGTDV